MHKFFYENKIPIGTVLSSEWCRCKDTAFYAFRDFKTNSFLNSFYDARFQKNKNKQIIELKKYIKKWNGKKILCGDFNNTAFSWVYRELSKNKQDAFKIAGKGLGKTFNYLYPLRIDFILVDLNFEVNNFKTFEVPYSDHFPILARIKLKN